MVRKVWAREGMKEGAQAIKRCRGREGGGEVREEGSEGVGGVGRFEGQVVGAVYSSLRI